MGRKRRVNARSDEIFLRSSPEVKMLQAQMLIVGLV